MSSKSPSRLLLSRAAQPWQCCRIPPHGTSRPRTSAAAERRAGTRLATHPCPGVTELEFWNSAPTRSPSSSGGGRCRRRSAARSGGAQQPCPCRLPQQARAPSTLPAAAGLPRQPGSPRPGASVLSAAHTATGQLLPLHSPLEEPLRAWFGMSAQEPAPQAKPTKQTNRELKKKTKTKQQPRSFGLSKQLFYLFSRQNEVHDRGINILRNTKPGKCKVMQGEGEEDRWANPARIHTESRLPQTVHLRKPAELPTSSSPTEGHGLALPHRPEGFSSRPKAQL